MGLPLPVMNSLEGQFSGRRAFWRLTFLREGWGQAGRALGLKKMGLNPVNSFWNREWHSALAMA